MANLHFDRPGSTRIQMKNLGDLLDLYREDCGAYPIGPKPGFKALFEGPQSRTTCKNFAPGGYIKGKWRPTRDAWGNAYIYESDGSHYILKSLGEDEEPGGTGHDEDIISTDQD